MVTWVLGLYVPLKLSDGPISLSGHLYLKNLWNVKTRQMQYVGELLIGSPAQKFSLVFDTGSSVRNRQWLWVPGANCDCHNSTSQFNKSESNTYVSSDITVTLKYGSGEAIGELGFDWVSLEESGEFAVGNQPLVVVSSDSHFERVKADGILGLSFPLLSSNYPTLVVSLENEGEINQAIFAVFLSDDKFSLDEDIQSNIMFGGYNEAKYGKSEIVWVKVFSESGY